MSYALRQVRPILNKTELTLFQDSRQPALRKLDARGLQSRVKRTRTLRDKYRDLYKRQTVRTRADKGASSDNQRTEMKADIMASVLERFENQLATLNGAEAPARAKPKVAARKPAAKKTPSAKKASKAAGSSIKSLTRAVNKAADKKAAAVPASKKASGAAAPAKAAKAKSGSKKATGTSAATQRGNPLKAKPINKTIHASARSRTKKSQARRDGR